MDSLEWQLGIQLLSRGEVCASDEVADVTEGQVRWSMSEELLNSIADLRFRCGYAIRGQLAEDLGDE